MYWIIDSKGCRWSNAETCINCITDSKALNTCNLQPQTTCTPIRDMTTYNIPLHITHIDYNKTNATCTPMALQPRRNHSHPINNIITATHPNVCRVVFCLSMSAMAMPALSPNWLSLRLHCVRSEMWKWMLRRLLKCTGQRNATINPIHLISVWHACKRNTHAKDYTKMNCITDSKSCKRSNAERCINLTQITRTERDR